MADTTPGMVKVVIGNEVGILPADEAAKGVARGDFRYAVPEEAQGYEERKAYSGPGGMAAAAGAGFARGAVPFGLSDLLLGQLTTPEDLAKLRAYNPMLSTGSEIAGGVALAATAGGALRSGARLLGAAGEAGLAGGTAAAEAAGTAGGIARGAGIAGEAAAAAPSLLARTGSSLVRGIGAGMAEGANITVQQAVTDAVLSGNPVTLDVISAEISKNILKNVGLGAGLGGVGGALAPLASGAVRAGAKAAETTSNAVKAGVAKLLGAADDASTAVARRIPTKSALDRVNSAVQHADEVHRNLDRSSLRTSRGAAARGVAGDMGYELRRQLGQDMTGVVKPTGGAVAPVIPKIEPPPRLTSDPTTKDVASWHRDFEGWATRAEGLLGEAGPGLPKKAAKTTAEALDKAKSHAADLARELKEAAEAPPIPGVGANKARELAAQVASGAAGNAATRALSVATGIPASVLSALSAITTKHADSVAKIAEIAARGTAQTGIRLADGEPAGSSEHRQRVRAVEQMQQLGTDATVLAELEKRIPKQSAAAIQSKLLENVKTLGEFMDAPGSILRRAPKDPTRVKKLERTQDALTDGAGAVLSELQSGWIYGDTISALKQHMPDMYLDLRGRVLREYARNIRRGSMPDYDTRVALGIAFDAPTDPTLDPRVIAAVQESYGAEQSKSDTRAAKIGGAPKLGQGLETREQRLGSE
jgi:hypothetical protein